MCRCVGGGNADGDADSDSDLEVVSDTFSVNLRCPVWLSLIDGLFWQVMKSY